MKILVSLSADWSKDLALSRYDVVWTLEPAQGRVSSRDASGQSHFSLLTKNKIVDQIREVTDRIVRAYPDWAIIALQNVKFSVAELSEIIAYISNFEGVRLTNLEGEDPFRLKTMNGLRLPILASID